jgi:hypothetical protein
LRGCAGLRRAHFVEGKKIKRIMRELRLSRNTVRGIVRAGPDGAAGTRRYVRTAQPLPQLGGHVAALDKLLRDNKPGRGRLTFQRMYAKSGPKRPPITVEGGHRNGDCGQQVMAA